jgi:uncharacterized protein YbjT (DUF2867 family)
MKFAMNDISKGQEQIMENNKVVIFGSTGNMGGAAAQQLLKRGWQVRAVTRNLESKKAAKLASMGAEIVQADLEDQQSLRKAIYGCTQVFSVQN